MATTTTMPKDDDVVEVIVVLLSVDQKRYPFKRKEAKAAVGIPRAHQAYAALYFTLLLLLQYLVILILEQLY